VTLEQVEQANLALGSLEFVVRRLRSHAIRQVSNRICRRYYRASPKVTLPYSGGTVLSPAVNLLLRSERAPPLQDQP
jgi:hypothetical protein